MRKKEIVEKLNMARQHFRNGEYRECLNVVCCLEREGCFSSAELVLKGNCIQLLEEPETFELEDGRSAYEAALEMDPQNIDALIEMGFFELNVLDQKKSATAYFLKAQEVAEERLVSALSGRIQCEAESNITEGKSSRSLLDESILRQRSLLNHGKIDAE